MRLSGRKNDELRKVVIETNVNKYAEGSCLVKFGDTHVICTATVEKKLPAWLKEEAGCSLAGKGWITAEYGMLPRATGDRMNREAKRGQSGRTQEIQRLIGRALRSTVNLNGLNEFCIKIDCDVIQADGGTRTASVTGGFVALYQALENLEKKGLLAKNPIKETVAAVSCGIYKGVPLLDLDYEEDSNAEADANFVLTNNGDIVEIQSTGEDRPIKEDEFEKLLELAKKGISELTKIQRAVLNLDK